MKLNANRAIESSLIALFFGLFYLTPYGFSVGSETVWLTDIISLSVLLVVAFFIFQGEAKFKTGVFRLTPTMLLLLILFLFEFVLPLIGVAVWGEPSSISSGIRATLYWLPLLATLSLTSFYKPQCLQRINRLIIVAVLVNLVFGLIELGIYFGKLPSFLNFRLLLLDFAPQERFANNRVMSFGFFQNSTAYGVFGFIALCHFLSRLIVLDSHKTKYYVLTLMSFMIIVLSTSRVPLAASVITFVMFIMFQRKTISNLFITAVLATCLVLTVTVLFTADIMLFSRFTRIIDGGLDNDYSLNERVSVLWPSALDYYFSLGHPTFTNPTKLTGTIDSGYLTYLLQGGWLFLFSVLAFIVVSGMQAFLKLLLSKRKDYFSFMALSLMIYLFLGMIISNPLRNPIVIAFVCFVAFGFSVRSKHKFQVPD